MGHFKEELTELEIIIKENFNSEDSEEYNFEIETEGEMVEIQLPIVQEYITEGDLNNEHNIKSK